MDPALDRGGPPHFLLGRPRGVRFPPGSRAETASGAEPFEPDPGHAGEGTGVSALAKPTIIVIGAGVAGLTSALELAERGLGVEVVERGRALGEGSCSWMAGGMLAPWCERATTEPEVADVGRADDRLVGRALPRARCARAAWWSPSRATCPTSRALPSAPSASTGWTPIGIAALEPDLAGRFRRALFFPDEAHLDPRRALAALAEAPAATEASRSASASSWRRRTRAPTSSSIAAGSPRATPCRTCAACAARWWWCARPTCRCSGRCACCIRASRSTSCRAAMACS